MSPSQRPLPSPAERPAADVVIYDGRCMFCSSQVQRLARWDRGQRLSYVSLHDPVVRERWPDLSHDQLMREMYVIDRAGRRHAGAAAFRYLTRRLPRLWVVAPLLHIPFSLPVWKCLYRQIASRRYGRQSSEECPQGTCQVHSR